MAVAGCSKQTGCPRTPPLLMPTLAAPAGCAAFLQATGYGGTVIEGKAVEDKIRRREENPDEEVERAAAARDVTVYFNADVAGARHRQGGVRCDGATVWQYVGSCAAVGRMLAWACQWGSACWGRVANGCHNLGDGAESAAEPGADLRARTRWLCQARLQHTYLYGDASAS